MHSPLDNVPPSTRLVAITLDLADEPVTTADLEERTCLSRSTVYRALERLRDEDLLKEEIDTSDARRRVYDLAIDDPLSK